MAGDLPTAPKGWGAILADPPWGWRTWGAVDKIPHRGAVVPYLPMRKQDLEAMPVANVAAHNCALFMWTVSSHLDQAIDLVRSWGFTYRSVAFIWVKTDKQGRPRMSLGRWTRQEAEICLIATTGRPPRLSGGVRQVIMAPRREHSRKPDEATDRIRRLVRGPYLELFSRETRPHWTSWGDQVGQFDGRETKPPLSKWYVGADAKGEAFPVACRAHVAGAVCDCVRCAHLRCALISQLQRA